jgi:proteasome lid subunit RPN8/RPN11
MPDSPAESSPGAWSVPECPFTIAYVPEVMDNIRLAVVDAFFSLPRGGAEIGGVLLGWHTQRRVTVADYMALDCEHAMGPSFVLSPNDETKLQELLAESKSNPAGLQPVGWYHSHTRSEIFLSDADQEIHNRFFPEPWQVALVMKPHTFQPMRCGFFFRETDGSIHATAAYQEFVLDAMPLRPVPSGMIPHMADGTAVVTQTEPELPRAVINVAPDLAAPPQATAPPAEPPLPSVVPLPLDAPAFASVAVEERSWLWLKVLVFLCVGLGAGAFGFQTRQVWMPKLRGAPRAVAAAPAPPAALNLSTFDTDGQLQIRWDSSSAAIHQATSGVLTIADGGLPARELHLDAEHLQGGTFTYGRESGQVDVTLEIQQRSGPPVRAAAAFVGHAPVAAASAPADDSEIVVKLKADLAAQQEQVKKAKKDLAIEVERNKKLEKSVSEVQAPGSDSAKLKRDLAVANDRIKKLTKNLSDTQNELKQQQRKRLGAQDPGK